MRCSLLLAAVFLVACGGEVTYVCTCTTDAEFADSEMLDCGTEMRNIHLSDAPGVASETESTEDECCEDDDDTCSCACTEE